MNAELLLKIAEMVEEIPEYRFNMNYYWNCSSGCAIGHAMDRGLLADSRRSDGTLDRSRVGKELGLNPGQFTFLFGGEAVRNVIARGWVPERAADYHGTTRWAVAQRIKEFVYARRSDLRPGVGNGGLDGVRAQDSPADARGPRAPQHH